MAGGFAADPDRAGDIDIFFLRYDGTTPALSQFTQGEWTAVYSQYDEERFVFAEGYWRGRKVQLLAATAYTVPGLLGRFDLSISQAAYTADGCRWTAPTVSRPGDPITVLRINGNTLERLEKFMRRYELPVR